MWLARTAIIHQLTYRDATDSERLFRYCAAQAGHPDFFIRKAIGWALREYAKTDPEAVKAFVAAHRRAVRALAAGSAAAVVSSLPVWRTGQWADRRCGEPASGTAPRSTVTACGSLSPAAPGFIGSHVADALADAGHDVLTLDALVPQAHGDAAAPVVRAASD